MQRAGLAVQLDPVAVAHRRQRAARGGLRRDVQHHGAVGRAAHARIGDPHHVLDALPQQLRRQAHVADLGHAGVALGSAVLHHQHRVGVDLERFVDDAGLVVLQVFEHDRAATVLQQRRCRGRRFEHRAARRQIAAQHADAAVRNQRTIERANHLVVEVRRVLDVVPQRPAVDGQRARMRQQAAFAKPAQHRGQAAGVVELLHQESSRRHQVDDGRRIAADAGPVLEFERHADAAGDRLQMDHRVGRTADRRIGADRILEGLARQDLGQAQPFLCHLDNADAGHVRQHVAARVDRRNRRVVRQRGAERLGHAGHRRRGAHRVAGAGRARHAGFGRQEMVQVDLAGLQRFVQLPDRGARADVLAIELAVEHRAAADDERRHVAAGRAHQQRRRGLVAAGQQHDGVDRIAANRFLDIHRRQIARQHRGRPQIRFAIGEHREFDREAAGFMDAALDVLGQLAEMRIAGRQFRPGVANTDDRPAIEFMIGNALVFHPAAVHEAVLVGGAEPLGGAELGF